MLEVVFTESAGGSLTVAMSGGKCIGEAVGVGIIGGKVSRRELKRMQKEAEEREKIAWAQAVPLKGSRRDIFCFSLALSVGELDAQGIGEHRARALDQLMQIYPAPIRPAAGEILARCRPELEALLRRTADGESLRIWCSDNPDERCGLYWLMAELCAAGLDKSEVTLVPLPDFEKRPDGTAVQYTSWGEVEPYQWGRIAEYGKVLPAALVGGMAAHWRQLVRENAPLRAVLGGRLVSAPETLYDFYILRELAAQPQEFMQAQVVGKVLGNYQLGIGDSWVALRMEKLVQNGYLKPVTEPGADDPIYHRVLRKCGEQPREIR